MSDTEVDFTKTLFEAGQGVCLMADDGGVLLGSYVPSAAGNRVRWYEPAKRRTQSDAEHLYTLGKEDHLDRRCILDASVKIFPFCMHNDVQCYAIEPAEHRRVLAIRAEYASGDSSQRDRRKRKAAKRKNKEEKKRKSENDGPSQRKRQRTAAVFTAAEEKMLAQMEENDDSYSEEDGSEDDDVFDDDVVNTTVSPSASPSSAAQDALADLPHTTQAAPPTPPTQPTRVRPISINQQRINAIIATPGLSEQKLKLHTTREASRNTTAPVALFVASQARIAATQAIAPIPELVYLSTGVAQLSMLNNTSTTGPAAGRQVGKGGAAGAPAAVGALTRRRTSCRAAVTSAVLAAVVAMEVGKDEGSDGDVQHIEAILAELVE